MTSTSRFDPSRPGAAADLTQWLTQRNTLDEDIDIVGEIMPLSVLTRPGGWRFAVHPSLFGQLVTWHRVLRRERTAHGAIGLYDVDRMVIIGRRNTLALLARAVFAAAVLAAGWAWSGRWLGPSIAAVTVWAVPRWPARVATVVAAAGVLVTWFVAAPVAPLLGVLVVAWVLRQLLGFVDVGVYAGPGRSAVGLLGRFGLARVLFDNSVATLALAVDKACGEDHARSGLFVASARTTCQRSDHQGVLTMCDALVAARAGQLAEALAQADAAERHEADSDPAIRGWLASHAAEILYSAGALDDAEARWRQSLAWFGTIRRTAYWATAARLRLAELLTARPDDTERCLEGLRLVYAVRRAALSRLDIPTLFRTEQLILRLMRAAGNTEGVLVHLVDVVDESDPTRRTFDVPNTEMASQRIMLAAMLVDVTGGLATLPGDDADVDAATTTERRQEAREHLDKALTTLAVTHAPVLAAQAYALLARLQEQLDEPVGALGNALEALQQIQHVRYQLPTEHWRRQWCAANAPVYALALRLAVQLSDAPLVAELLEVTRAQAIPLGVEEEQASSRAALDSLLSSTQFRAPASASPDGSAEPGAPDPAMDSADPLAEVTVLVAGASWVGGRRDGAVDLDHELDAMYPHSWYWSLARSGVHVHHALRSPDGRWLHTTTSAAELEPCLADVLRLLPVDLPGELPPAWRLPGTALAAESADRRVDSRSTAREEFRDAFGRLAQALLPDALADALSNGPEDQTLVCAPAGDLLLIPFAALPIDDTRLILDVATCVHLPSVALVAHRRAHALAAPAPGVEAAALRPVVCVLAPHCAPDDPRQDLRHAVANRPDAQVEIVGPAPKRALAEALATAAAPASVLYLAGHVDDRGGRSAATGFRFADGELGLRDLYATSAGPSPYAIPERVVLAGCASLGAADNSARRPDPQSRSLLDAPEWLGLGAAMLAGGAQHVLCTLYPVPDSSHTARVDATLLEAMRGVGSPAQGLRAMQRAELDRWSTGAGALPLAFLAYTYVGVGELVSDAVARQPADTVDDAVGSPAIAAIPGSTGKSANPAPPAGATPGGATQPAAATNLPVAPTSPPVASPPVAVAPVFVPVASDGSQDFSSLAPAPPERTWPEFALVTRRAAGSFDEKYDRLFPTRYADGAIAFGAADGPVASPIAVTGAIWRSAPILSLRYPLPVAWRLFDKAGPLGGHRRLNLYLTDCRLVLSIDKPPDAEKGEWLLGHIRYPWITSICFRPKQNWVYGCELGIGMQQQMVDNPQEHVEFQLDLMLADDVDSGALAQDLARRVARHNLTFGDLPDRARAGFTEMAHCARLDAPGRGDYATYYPGAFMVYPYGSDLADDGQILGTNWMGPWV